MSKNSMSAMGQASHSIRGTNKRFLGYLVVDPGLPVFEHHATGADKAGCLGIYLVFYRLHTGLQLAGSFLRINAQSPLQDAGSTVEFLGDKVHRAAVPLVTRVERPLVRIQARVLR